MREGFGILLPRFKAEMKSLLGPDHLRIQTPERFPRLPVKDDTRMFDGLLPLVRARQGFHIDRCLFTIPRTDGSRFRNLLHDFPYLLAWPYPHAKGSQCPHPTDPLCRLHVVSSFCEELETFCAAFLRNAEVSFELGR